MLGLLYDFFRSKIFYGISANSNFGLLQNATINVFGQEVLFMNYLSYLASLVSVIFIFVLCCLFVWKIIKLVGNLIK